jgi:hypothetical protein
MTRPGRILVVLIPAVVAALGGCVERTISITSEPPGAVVWLNDVEIGRTPVETDFTFYGVYDVRLRLEGYEPLLTSAVAKAPVYDLPAIDLLAEAVPATIESRIDWHFALVPLPELQEGADLDALRRDLVDRAKQTRDQLPPPAK